MTTTEQRERRLQEIRNFADQVFSPYFAGNLQTVGELAPTNHLRHEYARLSATERFMRGIQASHE